jgi:hypothetical protein
MRGMWTLWSPIAAVTLEASAEYTFTFLNAQPGHVRVLSRVLVVFELTSVARAKSTRRYIINDLLK